MKYPKYPKYKKYAKYPRYLTKLRSAQCRYTKSSRQSSVSARTTKSSSKGPMSSAPSKGTSSTSSNTKKHCCYSCLTWQNMVPQSTNKAKSRWSYSTFCSSNSTLTSASSREYRFWMTWGSCISWVNRRKRCWTCTGSSTTSSMASRVSRRAWKRPWDPFWSIPTISTTKVCRSNRLPKYTRHWEKSNRPWSYSHNALRILSECTRMKTISSWKWGIKDGLSWSYNRAAIKKPWSTTIRSRLWIRSTPDLVHSASRCFDPNCVSTKRRLTNWRSVWRMLGWSCKNTSATNIHSSSGSRWL